MSKLGQSSVLLLVVLVLVACQGSKQNGDTLIPDAAASEQTDQARQAASDASALEQIYQEGREAYKAGAALEQLGQRQEAMLKFNQAVGQFERVVLADPNHFNALVNWGSTLSRIGKPAAAVVKFQRALAIDPEHANTAEVYHNWGTALERLGRHQEAVEKFELAIALKADLLSPVLQGYLRRHRPRQPDSQIGVPPSGPPATQ